MYIEKIKNKPGFHAVGANDKQKIKSIDEYLKGVPPSYKLYLEEIGHGGVPNFDINGTSLLEGISALESDNIIYHETDKNLPENYVLLMDIGDDVTWYFDLNSRRDDGECKVVGWISGLTEEQQPDWVKEQETYDTFEDFFRSKIKEIEGWIKHKET